MLIWAIRPNLIRKHHCLADNPSIVVPILLPYFLLRTDFFCLINNISYFSFCESNLSNLYNLTNEREQNFFFIESIRSPSKLLSCRKKFLELLEIYKYSLLLLSVCEKIDILVEKWKTKLINSCTAKLDEGVPNYRFLEENSRIQK